jgi:copper chaperone CopZ
MIRDIVIVLGLAIVCGCAQQATDVPPAALESVTAASFNAEGAPTVEFSVPDMMCPEGCGEKTKEILAGQPGAKDVKINFEAKSATVAIEDGKFDADAALAALVDHGFDHSTLKDGAAAKPEVDAAPAVQ